MQKQEMYSTFFGKIMTILNIYGKILSRIYVTINKVWIED
jgi:hypothetical protein